MNPTLASPRPGRPPHSTLVSTPLLAALASLLLTLGCGGSPKGSPGSGTPSATDTCTPAGGTCVATGPGACANGSVVSFSCGAATSSVCCMPAGPDLGQWQAWPAPPDTPPDSEYQVDAGAGTVTDTITGLTWLQTEPPGRFDWPTAKATCAALKAAGHDDWRLPTAIELLSIVDFGASAPAIDTTVFPNASSDWTWTATPYVFGGANAGLAPWAVAFESGETTSYGEGQPGTAFTTPVRCVRGTAGRAKAPAYRVAKGTVYDPITGLTWQQAITASQVEGGKAAAYCRGLTLAGATWRLPTVKELASLVDRTSTDGWLASSKVFHQQGTSVSALFWTSTVATDGVNRWVVDLEDGTVMTSASISSVPNPRSVICVH